MTFNNDDERLNDDIECHDDDDDNHLDNANKESSSIQKLVDYSHLEIPSHLSDLLTSAEAHSLSLSTSAWRFESWLASYPLNRETVLDYFKHSAFYDRTCNNELAAIQSTSMHQHQSSSSSTVVSSTHNNNDSAINDYSQLLSSMIGVEYCLDHRISTNSDSLLLIRKQYRLSKNHFELLQLYFITMTNASSPLAAGKGTVFPLPTLASLLHCNLQSAIYYASKAENDIQSNQVINPSTFQFEYKFKSNSIDDQLRRQRKESILLDTRANRHTQSQLVDRAMAAMMSQDVKP